jgi:hypothetical protein
MIDLDMTILPTVDLSYPHPPGKRDNQVPVQSLNPAETAELPTDE